MKEDDTETLYRKYMLLQEKYRRLNTNAFQRQLQDFYRSLIPILKKEILELIKK